MPALVVLFPCCENTTRLSALHAGAKLRLCILPLPQSQMPVWPCHVHWLQISSSSPGLLPFCADHQLHTQASTCVTGFGNVLQIPYTANLNTAELLEWGAYTMPLERHRSKYVTIPTKSSGGLQQGIKCIKAWAFHSVKDFICEDFLLPL